MDSACLSIRRVTTPKEFQDIQDIHKTVWKLEYIDMHPTHMLTGIQKSNGLVLCAYYDNRPIGMLLSFCGITEDCELYLHCHNVGVLEEYRNLGVGFRLLIELKEYMVDKEIQLARATFDPLESRNAHLYFNKARCTCSKYYRDYYGPVPYSWDVSIPSDRLLIEYRFSSDSAGDCSDDFRRKAVSDLSSGANSQVINKTTLDSAGFPIPDDANYDLDLIEKMSVKRLYIMIPSGHLIKQQRDMGVVRKWRFSLRSMFEECFSSGLFISGFICLENVFFYALSRDDN